MAKYPEDWGVNEIHYHETGEVICVGCYKYTPELDVMCIMGGDYCPECAEEHECYWCGEHHDHLLPYDGQNVCEECKKALVEDEVKL